jgi:hypothetical protein
MGFNPLFTFFMMIFYILCTPGRGVGFKEKRVLRLDDRGARRRRRPSGIRERLGILISRGMQE